VLPGWQVNLLFNHDQPKRVSTAGVGRVAQRIETSLPDWNRLSGLDTGEHRTPDAKGRRLTRPAFGRRVLISIMTALENYIAELASCDDRRAEAVVVKLAALGGRALPALLHLLHENDGSAPQQVDRRWWALRAVAEIESPAARDALLQALADPDPRLRQCALVGLRLRPDERLLFQAPALLSDRDALVASLAADALIALGKLATPVLVKVLQDAPQAARLQAVRALARIQDPRSIPILFNTLDEDSALMEYWASEGLERLGVGMTFFKPA
jgi:HEAT repeat protein